MLTLLSVVCFSKFFTGYSNSYKQQDKYEKELYGCSHRVMYRIGHFRFYKMLPAQRRIQGGSE